MDKFTVINTNQTLYNVYNNKRSDEAPPRSHAVSVPPCTQSRGRIPAHSGVAVAPPPHRASVTPLTTRLFVNELMQKLSMSSQR